MYWLYLILAIGTEVAGTTLMKVSDGFTKIVPSILMFILYFTSFSFLTFALKRFEVGVAYAIWSGIGTAAISVIGVILFKESVSLIKIISIILIIIGVVGLNLTGEH